MPPALPRRCAGTARAQNAVDDFYRGKQITLLVGYGPGGGYDITARLVARYSANTFPAIPTSWCRTCRARARCAPPTHLRNAPKDGTAFALIARDTPLLGLLGVDPNVKFDLHKFGWIGSSSSYANDAYVLVLGPKAPVHTIAEARKPDSPPLVLGGTGAGGTDADVPKILRDTIGIRIKQVLGYTATPAIVLAVERGEVDGRTFDYSYVKTSRPQWLKPDSGFHILVQFARRTRHPDLPDVPTARELALDADARELIVFAETPLLTMARPMRRRPACRPNGWRRCARRSMPRTAIRFHRGGQQARRRYQPGHGGRDQPRARRHGARIARRARLHEEADGGRQGLSERG